ncbi:MAG: EAL domain-containing protein [Steroidobacteraceae bacterium]|jgi:EAL domain-containing protein (putative c-di-GMP-specific phosphodiesterase class I)/GGDEF domain-containing protein
MAEIPTHELPDLVVLVRRDGVIMSHLGGKAVGALVPPPEAAGGRLEAVWPEAVASCVKQAVRRCIAQRQTVETRFECSEIRYELRAFAQGPDRALCVIRVSAAAPSADESPPSGDFVHPQFDRRGFLSRFNDTLSQAAIQEKPAALALVYLDGLTEIARVVDAKISDQVLSAALLRLPQEAAPARAGDAEASWYLGQLSADLLAIVIESSDRDAIERVVWSICTSLREPLQIGDASFHLTPYAGVSILGQDGSSPRSLLDKARSAAAESRRTSSSRLHFFTDTLKLRALARLDVAREIRDAIANREIRLRYVGRHDLATGQLVARIGYLRWNHPLRGELAPAEFLGVAETTGLAALLSRSLLESLSEDFEARASALPAEARLSFGPLRHHLLQDDFVDDIGRTLAQGAVPAARLEIRISERTFATMDLSVLQALSRLGVQLVVDEMGRGFGSLDRLARAPIWGLQLDRAWVTALRSDSVALRVCRAGISAAAALGVTPIATGVDDVAQRDALLELGCRHGSGDLYGETGRAVAARGLR